MPRAPGARRRWTDQGSRAIACAAISVVLAAIGSDAAPRTRVSIEGSRWLINGRPPHEGSPAEGLLMNVRMVNAVFEDSGPAANTHLPGFDPVRNTTRFISRLPEYVAHGVTAFTVGLQGGFPGYEGAVNSAFDSDGSLRPSYMNRVARVIEAADRHGAVVILSAFYQRQHSHERTLSGRPAALNAVAGLARWVTAQHYTNVVLEVSNEYRHAGFGNWPDGDWLRSTGGQVELIRHAKMAAPRLLVSTSGMGDGTTHAEIAEAADFVLLHLNDTPLAGISAALRQAQRHGKPVVVNEDDKTGEAGADAARLAVASGAAWGFMHSAKNQSAPFEFGGAADDPAVYAMVRRLTTVGTSVLGEGYFPPADAAGGWRALADRRQVRRIAGIDPEELDEAFAFIQGTTKNGGLLVLRHGWLVYERYFGRGHREATANLASIGKSFTSLALGILIDERPDLFPARLDQKVFTPAYFPPEAFPLSDPRKAAITLGQLLAFTACIRGNNPGYVSGEEVVLDPPGPDGWPAMVDAVALGREDVENGGVRTSARTLWCEPGGGYSYATSSIHLASMILRHVTGLELEEFLRQRLATPLGWSRWGFGYRHAGRLAHTPGGGGIVARPTDLLRFGYLLLNRGRWKDQQIVPEWFLEHAIRKSSYNPHYAYSLQFDVNTEGGVPDLPRDAFWKAGSGGHALYVVPSLDLVVWKFGGRDGQYEPRDTGMPVHPDATGEETREGWKQTVGDRAALTDTLRRVVAAIPGR
ncbi:MAG TPA: serine hydrolase [Vicinamibacterales bacterium]|nr:serine hydrolase [Vicinamibacterales bacterium]